MGQDTFVNSGISVKLPLTFENRKHICNLFESYNCRIFLQKEDDYDEVKEVEKDYIETYKDLLEIDTKYEFDKECEFGKEYEYNLVFYFLYPVFDAHARNISRRENPNIYEHTYESPDSIINKINIGKEFFLSMGIPQKDIKFGFSFHDSY